MTQLDDLQAYTNLEMPRRVVLLTPAIVGYDGDPNDGGAPAILQNAPAGTYYRQETPLEVYWQRTTVSTWLVSSSSVGQSVTEEDFTVTISATGEDPTGPLLIRNQAESTAWGDFATIPAAIATLPEILNHIVTVVLPDGVYELDGKSFGNLSRFEVGYKSDFDTGAIRFRGLNWIRAASTSTYTVLSSDQSVGSVTLTADPGFSVDQYRSYYMRIVSGPNAGAYRPIRTHNGVTFYIAGDVAPITNSVVEIVTPATQVKLYAQLHYMEVPLSSIYRTVEFARIEFIPPDAVTWGNLILDTHGHIMISEGCRFNQVILIASSMGKISQRTCVFLLTTYVPSYDFGAIVATDGGFRTDWGSSRPLCIIALCRYGIFVQSSGSYASQGASAFTFKAQSVDGVSIAAIGLEGPYSTVYISGGTAGADNWWRIGSTVPYAIHCKNGSKFSLSKYSDFNQASLSTFRGATNDLLIDGVGIDWSDIYADSDKCVLGSCGAKVIQQV